MVVLFCFWYAIGAFIDKRRSIIPSFKKWIDFAYVYTTWEDDNGPYIELSREELP